VSHVILLGDSIFDNARYVPGGPAVIERLRRILPSGWKATLCARDGAVTREVAQQLEALPEDATHLVVSAGGNDALEQSGILFHDAPQSFVEGLGVLAEIREQFRESYQSMLRWVLACGKPTVVCTVYDAIPGLDRGEAAGLALFNEVILREAFRYSLPVIDLRLTCNEASDYSSLSSIEPSVAGGGKIARAICSAVQHDFVEGGRKVFV
jgi:hypothetical protein